ncbi:MAG: protein phosphatase 2C domain-containing protein [Bacteroidales bacterium]|nr:protein phosphatase 2C domain-containing protein [Bacteroidales bacterium]
METQYTKAYALHQQGKRSNNEDAIFPPKNQADETTHFYIVCDGMGGHEHGEVASNSVCESFATYLKDLSPDDFDETVFDHALDFAYDRLDQIDDAIEMNKKMGTTLAFLHLNKKQAFMAHIGDSRIYHLRKGNDGNVQILYQSSDHSLVNELVKAEMITEEEAAHHPKKNIITRAMQPHLEDRFRATIHTTRDVKAGDRFFLCSDGVLEGVTNDQLCDIVAHNDHEASIINAINELCQAHSRDNYSAWLVPVRGGSF